MAASAGFRRAAAVGLLVLVAVAFWRFAVEPVWRGWRDDAEAVAAHRDAIGRFRGLAAAREDYASALAEIRRQSGRSDALIRAASATLAAADLQQRVKALVETAGGTLVSAQPGEGAAAGPFTRVDLSVRMLITIDALQKVLHDLESGAPLVVIDELQIPSRQSRAARRRGRQVVQPETGTQLDVRLKAAAFVAVTAARGAG